MIYSGILLCLLMGYFLVGDWEYDLGIIDYKGPWDEEKAKAYDRAKAAARLSDIEDGAKKKWWEDEVYLNKLRRFVDEGKKFKHGNYTKVGSKKEQGS